MKTLILLIVFFLQMFSLSAEAQTNYMFRKSCKSLKNQNWFTPKKCIAENNATLDFSLTPELFCQVTLKEKTSLKELLNKAGFFRDTGNLKVMSIRDGSIVDYPEIGRFIFSRRDLSFGKSAACTPLQETPVASYYVLNLPISLYALQSGLKKIEPKKKKKKVKIKKPVAVLKESVEVKSDKPPVFNEPTLSSLDTFDLSFSYRLFYETLNGTQTSNSSKAKISNQISPSINFSIHYKPYKKWSYGLRSSMDFHLFKRDTSLFSVDTENVITANGSILVFYKLRESVNLFLSAGIENELHYVRKTASSIEIEKNLAPQVALGSNVTLLKRALYQLRWTPQMSYSFSGEDLSSGFSFDTPFIIEVNGRLGRLGLTLGFKKRSNQFTDLKIDQEAFYFGIQSGYLF